MFTYTYNQSDILSSIGNYETYLISGDLVVITDHNHRSQVRVTNEKMISNFFDFVFRTDYDDEEDAAKKLDSYIFGLINANYGF